MANLTNRGVEFTTPGLHIWNVPAGVESVWVRMTGAGGAGGGYTWANNNRQGAAGGGSGEYCYEMPLPCTPGGTVSVLVGAGGVATVGVAGDGGVSTVVSGLFSVTCMGGQGGDFSGPGGGGGIRGAGGGPRGGDYPGVGNRNGFDGTMGGATGTLYGAGAESISHYGGSSGGGGVSPSIPRGLSGGPCEANPGVLGGTRTLGIGGSYNAGGSSGASSAFGLGGQGGQGTYDENTPNHVLFCYGKAPLAGAYGAGGGGAGCFGASSGGPGGNLFGGDGAPGYVMFLWFETI